MKNRVLQIVKIRRDENEKDELVAEFMYCIKTGTEDNVKQDWDADMGVYFTQEQADATNGNRDIKNEIEVEEGYYYCVQNRGYTDYLIMKTEEELVARLAYKYAFLLDKEA